MHTYSTSIKTFSFTWAARYGWAAQQQQKGSVRVSIPPVLHVSYLEVRQEEGRLVPLGFAVLHSGSSEGVIELHRLVRSDPHFILKAKHHTRTQQCTQAYTCRITKKQHTPNDNTRPTEMRLVLLKKTGFDYTLRNYVSVYIQPTNARLQDPRRAWEDARECYNTVGAARLFSKLVLAVFFTYLPVTAAEVTSI